MDETVNSAQFAAVATKDDMQLVVILMDSNKENAASEAKSLLEYGDAAATKNTIVKKGKLAGHARVRGGAVTRVPAYTECKGFAYVPPEGSDSLITTQVSMYDDLEAPLEKGDKVGEFRIYVADELKGTVDLIIKEDVPVGWFPSRYYLSNRGTIVAGVILFLLLLFSVLLLLLGLLASLLLILLLRMACSIGFAALEIVVTERILLLLLFHFLLALIAFFCLFSHVAHPFIGEIDDHQHDDGQGNQSEDEGCNDSLHVGL